MQQSWATSATVAIDDGTAPPPLSLTSWQLQFSQVNSKHRWWEELKVAGKQPLQGIKKIVSVFDVCVLQSDVYAAISRCGDVQMGAAQPPQRKKDKLRYHHGQHSCYYGYHGFYGDGRVGGEEDPRLRLLEVDWFRDKRVLDVGCGAGHLTLAVARKFNPSHILGVELDEQLVHAAKQNIRHFLSHDLVVNERNRGTPGPTSSCPSRTMEEGGGTGKVETAAGMQADHVVQELQQALSLLTSFPLSLRVSRGPLSAPPLLLAPSSASSRFPNNVTFIQVSLIL